MSGSYFLYGFILEKCGNFWKNGCFSGRIWPDWGNTAWADMAGLGSIGLKLTRNSLPITVCSFNKTNIFFTLSLKNVLFILNILFSVTMVTC